MGGSLATLASRAVVFGKIHDPNKIRLVTFGEPRVFDREFAKIHNYMVCNLSYFPKMVCHKAFFDSRKLKTKNLIWQQIL